MISDVKILKISDINNIKCHEVSSDFTLAARMSYFPFRGVVSLLCHPEDNSFNVIQRSKATKDLDCIHVDVHEILHCTSFRSE